MDVLADMTRTDVLRSLALLGGMVGIISGLWITWLVCKAGGRLLHRMLLKALTPLVQTIVNEQDGGYESSASEQVHIHRPSKKQELVLSDLQDGHKYTHSELKNIIKDHYSTAAGKVLRRFVDKGVISFDSDSSSYIKAATQIPEACAN